MWNLTFKNSNTPTTAGIALWYTFGNVFVRGIAFVTTPIFTRLMSKEEYGAFSNFTSWESIIAVIITLDFAESIAVAKYDYGKKIDTYLSSILLFSSVTTTLIYLIVEWHQDFFVSCFKMDMIYIRALFFYVMFIPAFTYLQIKHRIYKQYKFFVLFSILQAGIGTLLSVGLVLMMDNKLLGRTIGYVIPASLMNLCLWILIIKKGRRFEWDCVKYAALISVPLIPHALSGIILGSFDRIMITQYCGTEANAMYTLAYQISLLANILWQSMNQAWAPWLYDSIYNNNFKAIWRNSKLYLGAFSIPIIGVYLFAPEAMLILGGTQYYEARFVMPPVIMGCVFQFVYGMYVNLELYAKMTSMISIGTVSAALVNIGLNAIFIPQYGYIAAAYTTLISYGALLAFHFFIVKFRVRDLSNIYDESYIFALLCSLFGFFVLALLLYDNNTIRYIVIAIYISLVSVGIYKYRKKFISY